MEVVSFVYTNTLSYMLFGVMVPYMCEDPWLARNTPILSFKKWVMGRREAWKVAGKE